MGLFFLATESHSRLNVEKRRNMANQEKKPKAVPKEVLVPLCGPFRRQADCLLDLHELTREGGAPGRCVQCFFRLLGASEAKEEPALTPLRRWIEEHITITIEAGGGHAGTLPVRLEAPDLDSFCRGVMNFVREDTAIQDARVELSFRYKEA